MITSRIPALEAVADLVASNDCQGFQLCFGSGFPKKAIPDAQTCVVGSIDRVAPHADSQTLGEYVECG